MREDRSEVGEGTGGGELAAVPSFQQRITWRESTKVHRVALKIKVLRNVRVREMESLVLCISDRATGGGAVSVAGALVIEMTGPRERDWRVGEEDIVTTTKCTKVSFEYSVMSFDVGLNMFYRCKQRVARSLTKREDRH